MPLALGIKHLQAKINVTVNRKVYAIVVTYNGMKWIDKCFSSLINSSIPLNILAIDNGSDDETVNTLKQNFPQVEVVETGLNLGFGKANNIGLKRALNERADYVFLLNQDAWVQNDCIENLIEVAQQQLTFGILAPFQLSYDGGEVETYFNDYVLNKYSPEFNNNEPSFNTKSVYKSSFIHAAGWLLPYSTLLEVGGFDPLFFHYGEDNDYVQRVHFRNKFVGFVPKAVMCHFGTNEGLKKMQANKKFKLNFSIVSLKNLKGSYMGVWLLFFKSTIKEMVIAFFKIDIKSIKLNAFILRKGIANFNKINVSRNEQKNSLAYLR
jgi:GT2 family glycosyltransferase